MKNKKKTIIIIIVSIISLLIIGAVVFGIVKVVQKAEKERKDRIAREKEITSKFEEFKENALAFGEESVEYRTWIKNDINDATAYQYDAWVLSLDNMTTYIDKMAEVAPMYQRNCINRQYSNASVQEKCDAFMDAYERAINTYVVDVTDFNEKIKELAEKTKKEELKEYELKYEKVDLNNNNEFAEIEMEATEATDSE